MWGDFMKGINKISKFKLYKYNMENKKYKILRNISKVLVPVVIVTSFFGCTNNKKYDYNSNVSHNIEYIDDNYETTIHTDEINTHETIENTNTNDNLNLSLVLDEYGKFVLNSNVMLNSNSLDNFINNVNNIEVSYKYSDIYNMQYMLNKYESTEKYTSTEQNLFVNGRISSDTIFAIVKENNANANLAKVQFVSDSELIKVCGIISDLLNDVIKNNPNIDLNLLSEKIKNLKIVTIDEFANGFFDPATGKMGFSFEYMKNKGTDYYKEIVEHETYHFIQSNSLNEIKDTNINKRLGFVYDFNDVKINSLLWNWFYETGAEYLTCNRNNTREPNLYEAGIKDFDTIKVCTVLLSQNKLDTFENLSLSNNISDLFDYFGCKTDKDKIEISNMMYSYSLKNNFSYVCDDFFDNYAEKYGESITKEALKKVLNDDIAQSLTKIFYKNLASLIRGKTIKVEEVFSMISVFENEISRTIWYNSNVETLSEFYSMYENVQSDFFQILAESLIINVDEVQQIYNAYNKNTSVNFDNTTLVDESKKDFYKHILETREGDKMNSINYVFEKYNSLHGNKK